MIATLQWGTLIICSVVLLLRVPDAIQGRVFGAFEAAIVSALLLGALATGPLLALIGPRATTVAMGLVALASLAFALPRLRRLGVSEPGRSATESREAAAGAELSAAS